DGILCLGVAHKGRPSRLVGFDVNPTDVHHLGRRAQEEGVPPTADGLEFQGCEPDRLPAPDNSFDIATTWSAFEHIADPQAVLREIRRILRPSGVLFLQLWPFYYSERGSHLWDWFPEGFHHL